MIKKKTLEALAIDIASVCVANVDTRNLPQKMKALENLVKFSFLSCECGVVYGYNFFLSYQLTDAQSFPCDPLPHTYMQHPNQIPTG